ncbi:energy transducer TonB [Paraburkholderia rhizosphaerae]|uniref:Outer membrane transport energization protein TonB n=1 Tax=Paraburkholderia rhizosphaerae TaxID=480658 RepID=A0A4R8LHP0_9BURK|nr:energy transducer TonB [Paraburkholderia rhizosphaerae]TDY42667.1 outer membrane transport energization protein TonB [Paraburkholderia rhizosphaerae]
MTDNVRHNSRHNLRDSVHRMPLHVGNLLDAHAPRALVCVLAAVAIWLGFAAGFVRGLWLADNNKNAPKPVALDVKMVRLSPPEPPPEPPPQPQQQPASRAARTARTPQPATPAPAAQPKPAHAGRHSVAPAPHALEKPTPSHDVSQQATTATAAPSIARPTQPTLAPPSTPSANSPPPATPAAPATQANGPQQEAKGPATASSPSASASAGNGPAHAILQPLPSIPDDLREDAFQAIATARFSVHRDGSVDVELIKPTHNPRLNQLLLDALKKWRFFPAMKDGEPIDSTQDVRVHFNVD